MIRTKKREKLNSPLGFLVSVCSLSLCNEGIWSAVAEAHTQTWKCKLLEHLELLPWGTELCSCTPGAAVVGWEFVLLQFLQGFPFQPLWKSIQSSANDSPGLWQTTSLVS